MATSRTRRRPAQRPAAHAVGKPRGVLHPRVQLVGPEHFGILCFDCAKTRSKFLLADFYGRVLIPPTTVAHNRPDLDAAVAQVRQAFATHQLRDGLVAIERTGRYEAWTTLLLLIRQRRDLVRKGAALNCQIRDHLEAALPGFAACFNQLWDNPVAWHLLDHFASAERLHAAGVTAICQSLRQAAIRFQHRTVQTVLDWAAQTAPGDIAADQHRRIAWAYYRDRQ